MRRAGNTREVLFRLGVILKGLDGLLEMAGGIALWLVSPGLILRWVGLLTQDEIARNRHDVIAHHLRLAVGSLVSGRHFLAMYLLAHGIVKILVVVALLKNRLWAYPVAIGVFSGFIAYQLYRFTLGGSAGLIVLSAFDLIVIGLIWMEYRARKLGPHRLREAVN
jgi:uncharacterized membrane protein